MALNAVAQTHRSSMIVPTLRSL